MADVCLLKIKDLLADSYRYWREKRKEMLGFSCVNFLFLAAVGQRVSDSLWFLLWAVAYYMFSCFFFRYYFKRSPYIFTKKIFHSLVPASKIIFVVMLFLTLLAYLPYLPLLFGLSSGELLRYITRFIGDYMGESRIYDTFISLVLLLCSPFLLYRPCFAWISAVIGRSGQLRSIWRRTQGYYFTFLGIIAVFYGISFIIQLCDSYWSLNNWLLVAVASVLTIYFNIVMAKSYEILFLE